VPTTQTVTILFTDVVGSTELSSRLGPEASDKLRQNHFSLLRQALAANGGSEVKNLGDGLMAVFSTPSSAVACAVTMQQAVEHDNRRSADRVGLRIGLSGGEVTIEDDDYFGDPVVEAARICAICEGGQILAADIVRVMAGRRSAHCFVEAGEQNLKGLPDPVAVCSIEWEPTTDTSGIPLPERLETPSRSLFGFFGRRQELEHLVEALKHSIEGSRRTAFISGEPGIGKTTLCRQLAQTAHELGVCVLYGRCDEDLTISYQPFAEALNHLVINCDDSLLSEHVDECGGALLSLVPALAKRTPRASESLGADLDSERLRLFGAVMQILASASANAGVLLVVDDLHWADKASLQLLRHVCSSTQLSNVMVVGTYRDSELSAGNALSDTLASLRREANAERVDLDGLDDSDILEMMEQVAGQTMEQDGVELAHAVRRETDGNAFFTTELLRHLGETGLVYQDDTGRWVARDDLYERGLPQSVREVVGQRIDRLGDQMRRVLSAAAVIGREFDIEVLAAVVDIDEDDLLDIVEEGVNAGLLTEVEGTVERFSFAHALTQHTLYEDLGATRRSRGHRKIADVLEQLYGSAPETRAAELARHFVAATKTVDAGKALTYSKLAGDQALARLAPADAVGWFAQALELYPQVSPDETLHCDLLIGLGTAQRRAGDPAHRQTLLDAAAIAQALGDRGRLVTAAIANSRGSAVVTGEVDHEKVSVVGAALAAIEPGDSAERAILLAILGAELIYGGDRDRWSSLIADALAMARRLDEPHCFLVVTGGIYSGHYTPDTVEERLVDLGVAASLAEQLGDPKAEFHANYNRAIACVQKADRGGFDAHLEKVYRVADRIGEPFESWQAMTIRSVHSFLVGDLDRSEREAGAALAVAGQSVPEAMAAYGAELIEVHRARGDRPALTEMTELMAAAASENPGLPILRAALARSYCDLDRDEEALAVIEDDIGSGFALYPYDTTWFPSMTVLAEICVHLRRADGAALLYDKLRPWHALVSTAQVTTQGPTALHLGTLATLLTRYEDAARDFAEAHELSQKLGSPYWIARTEIAWALMCRMAGSDAADGADEMLAKGVAAARLHGFGGLVEMAERQP
jgi:class 3 adenylate cyclase